VPGADVAFGYGSGRGGLRADLPTGPLNFGHAYDAFPFDNRITRVALNGAQLERVIAAQLPFWIDGRRGLPGVAGVRVAVTCEGGNARVRLLGARSAAVAPDAKLVVALASNTVGRFAATALAGETAIESVELPLLVRDAAARWLLGRGRVAAEQLLAEPRWDLAATACGSEPN
jgi:5'-nucleotidase